MSNKHPKDPLDTNALDANETDTNAPDTNEWAGDEFEAPSEDEMREADRLRSLLDAVDGSQLEGGGFDVDALPSVDDDDELVRDLSFSHLLRSMGDGDGNRDDEVYDRVWGDLASHVPSQSAQAGAKKRKGGTLWLWFGMGGMIAATVALMSISTTPPAPTNNELGESQKSAVAALESREAEFAAQLMANGSEPTGDTKLRAHREARFDAYRVDASRGIRRAVLSSSGRDSLSSTGHVFW